MNVTTFDGLPVIKQPPISGWRDFLFVRMENPKHGDLLPGQGLQLLYEPYEGYTGFDKFKFQYSDKHGKIKGTVTVDVVVKPIPVFNLNNGGRSVPEVVVGDQNKEYNQLADEPTGSLDTKNGKIILDLIKKHQEKMGATLIIITHDLEIAKQTEHIIKISDGKIAA